ncbi:MAG TPA: GldG family protein [Spirochaetia bacterium]|nr:GldG family protein [Spirochaetia bacterium]
MTRKTQEMIVVTMVGAVVVLFALNSVRFFSRADITENRIYTISKVSQELFAKIPDQVSITYYASDRLKALTPEVQQIEDLLVEYAAQSRGKVKISFTDPIKAHVEQQMQGLGIVPQQIQVVQQDQQSLATVYSGIVISYLDRTKAIPVVFDTTTLEYDLTSSIEHLLANTQPVLGVITGDDGKSLNQNYRLLGNVLSQYYTVRQVQSGETIPPDVSVLFVLGNQNLDDFDLFPIDQYIMGGGKVLFAVDGVAVDLQRNLSAAPMGESPLLSMIEHYGIKVGQELVLDTHNRRIPVREQQGQIAVQTLHPYPMWVSILQQDVSRTNPITAHFSGLDLLWPSPLTVLKREGVTAQALVSTSQESWLMKSPFVTNPSQPGGMQKDASTNPGPFTVAATLTGTFESYFSDKPIPTREGVTRDWKVVKKQVESSRMIVVGNTEFASDLAQYSNSSYNMSFLANAASWLSSEDQLLSIRTRAARDLRLDAIQNPAARQFAFFFSELLNIFVIPIAVIIFAFLRMYRRRERSYLLQAPRDKSDTGGAD